MTPAARDRLRVRVPLLIVSGAAWLALFALPSVCSLHTPLGSLATHSALMFAAMMLPLISMPLRHVRDRSFAHRRPWALTIFVMSYGLLWTAAGIVLMRAAVSVPPIVAVIAALSWQCSPAKQRCLNHCHAHPPLAAFGLAADASVLRFGATHALWCIASCSGIMLLPMIPDRGQFVAMAAATVWLASEKLQGPMPPQWALRGPEKIARIAISAIRTTARPPADSLAPQ